MFEDSERWHVVVRTAGPYITVEPVKGMITSTSRTRYPATSWGLRRALRSLSRWCDRQNRREERARRIVQRWQERGA